MGNHTPKSTKDVHRSPPKYLFLDLVSILEGSIPNDKISNNDLICRKINESRSQILRNGVKILCLVNILVEEFGYSIVFHSSHKLQQQLDALEAVNNASKVRGIKKFPAVLVMSVRDSSLCNNVEPANPVIIKNHSHGIWLACYGKKQNGKICARKALSKLLHIPPNDRKRHTIIDSDPLSINTARAEGWNVHDTKNSSLLQIIEDIYQREYISRYEAKRKESEGLENSSLLSKTVFKAIDARPTSLGRIFVDEKDKSEWIGKCSEKAIGGIGLNKEAIAPDHYTEYNEFLANRLYNYFGVTVPDVLFSERLLNLETQKRWKIPQPNKPRLHLMVRCMKNFKEFGPKFITDYKATKTEGYFEIERRPLEGVGKCLAVMHFLNEENWLDEAGDKVGYICLNEKNQVIKVDCKDALAFPDLFGENTKQFDALASGSSLAFNELNKSDQNDFVETVREILNTSNEVLSLIFEPIISIDSRFKKVLDKLLNRKDALLTTFPPEVAATLSQQIEKVRNNTQKDVLSEITESPENEESSKLELSRVESRRYKIIIGDADHLARFQILTPSEFFSGRKYEQDQITKFFEAGEPIVCLVGISGIGKSELAAQYLHQAAYSTVIWLQAEQDVLFTQMQIYMQARFNIQPGTLDKAKLVSLFYENLILHNEDDEKKICVVIDGANNQEEITGYLPDEEHRKHFNILVISCYKDWLSVPTVVLQPFRIDETSEYLRKRLELQDLAGIIDFNTLLEGLPLSIKQAVSFIEQNQITLEEYCHLYKEDFESQTLELEKPETRIAYRVLELSLSKIAEKKPGVDERLSIFAYISPNGIDVSLLQSYYDSLDDFEGILELLTAYSIISQSSEETEYKMHPLTQASLRLYYIKNNCYDKYAERTYNFLLPKLSYKEGILEDAQRVSLLIPHAAALCGLQSSLEDKAIAEMLHKIALHQHYAAGNYQTALKYYQRALEINEKCYGRDHIQTASVLINLANAWGCLGEYETKKNMLKIGAEITEAHFGKDHPKTAIILINLANAWGSLGNYQCKRDLLVQALLIIEKRYGRAHPQTGITLANLGSALLKLKEYEMAYECQSKAYKIFHKQFGEENKHTRFSANQLKQIEGSQMK